MQGRWQHPAKKWPAAAQISTQLAAWVQVTLPKMSNRQAIQTCRQGEGTPSRPYLDNIETLTAFCLPEKYNNYSFLGIEKAPKSW